MRNETKILADLHSVATDYMKFVPMEWNGQSLATIRAIVAELEKFYRRASNLVVDSHLRASISKAHALKTTIGRHLVWWKAEANSQAAREERSLHAAQVLADGLTNDTVEVLAVADVNTAVIRFIALDKASGRNVGSAQSIEGMRDLLELLAEKARIHAATSDHKQWLNKRIEIPVHYDLWARGAKTGTVTGYRESKTPGQSDYLTVRMDHPQVKGLLKLWRIDWAYIKLL